MKISEQIDILRAVQDGKAIQARSAHCSDIWRDAVPAGAGLNFASMEFRIKPEPRDFWIWEHQPYQQILTYKPVNQGFMHVREVIE